MLVLTLVLSVVIAGIGTLIIGVVGGSMSTLHVGFTDRDHSAASADLRRYLSEDLEIDLLESEDTDLLRRELIEKHISAIIEVPDGFEASLLAWNDRRGTNPDAGVAEGAGAPGADMAFPANLTFLGDYENEAFVRGYLDSYMSSLAVSALAADGDAGNLGNLLAVAAAEKTAVSSVSTDPEKVRMISEQDGYRVMLGFFIYVSFVLSVGFAQLLFSDRTAGTYQRIKGGQITSLQYTAAMTAVGMATVLLVSVVPFAWFALKGYHTGVPIAVVILMSVLFSFFVVSLSLLLGISMPSFNGITTVLVGTATITSMLGGAFFPIETAPEAMRHIAQVTPQYWFYEVVSSYQDGAGRFGISAAIIGLLALLLFILAGVRFASNEGKGARPA
jgi:ABC-2 type transport system permease protein